MKPQLQANSVQEYKELLEDFRANKVVNHKTALKHLYRLLQNTLSMAANAENVVVKQKKEIEHLEKLTLVDAMTGLYNKRGLETMLRREINLVKHELAAPGVLVHFEVLNRDILQKHFGKDAVYEVEIAVADMLKSHFRPFDTVAHVGDGSFTIMMPQAKKAMVRDIHNNIKHTLKSFRISWRGRSIPAFLTCSMAEIEIDTSAREVMARLIDRARDNDGQEIGKHQIH